MHSKLKNTLPAALEAIGLHKCLKDALNMQELHVKGKQKTLFPVG